MNEETTNEGLQWASSYQSNTTKRIKELNSKLERKAEMITVRDARITELQAQIAILMRVIKES